MRLSALARGAPALSIRNIFARHRHRFLSPEERTSRVLFAVEALDRDRPDTVHREGEPSPLELATALLAHAPYDPQLRRALARHAARRGDDVALREHLEAALDPEGTDLETLRADLEGLLPDLEERLDALVQGWAARARVLDLMVESVGAEEPALVWSASADDAVRRAYVHWLDHLARVLAETFDEPAYLDWAVLDLDELESPFSLEGPFDKGFGDLGAILRFFHEVAPHVDDLRLLIYDQTSNLHEVWIVDGVCYALEHTSAYDTELQTQVLEGILAEVGEDPELRALVIDGWRRCLSWVISALAKAPERRPEAEAHLQRLRSLGDNPLVLQALFHDGLGEAELAREALRRALVIHPGWREMWLLLAERLLEVGAFEEAFAAAHEASCIAYYCDNSRLLCAIAKASVGDREGARSWIQAHIQRYGAAFPGALLRQAGELFDAYQLDLAIACGRWLAEQLEYKTRGEALLERSRLRREEGSLDDALAELVARPGDVDLRSQVADRLVNAGHLSGPRIRAQLDHDRAETFAERQRFASLIQRLPSLPSEDQAHLEWELGFVRSAELAQVGADHVHALLADPAGRLLQELLVPAIDEELAQVIRQRPRPSALRRIYVHSRDPSEVPATYGDSLGLDVPVEPWHGESPAALLSWLRRGEHPEHNQELHIYPIYQRDQLDQRSQQSRDRAVLPLLPGALASALEVIDGWSERVRKMLVIDDAAEELVLYQIGDRCYAGLSNLLRALDSIAPFVGDVRFTVWDSNSEYLYDVTLRQGRLTVIQGELDEDDDDLRRAWFVARAQLRPEDEALRRFAVELVLEHADLALRRSDAQGLNEAQELFDVVAGMDCRHPGVHRLRARCAERIGDTDAAEEAYRFAARTDEQASLSAALAALTGGRDEAALAHITAFRRDRPKHTLALWIEGYLRDDPSLLAGLIEGVEGRDQRVEPDLHELAATPRFAALARWLIGALPTPSITAARYLVAVAQSLVALSEDLAQRTFEAAIARAPEDPRPWLASARTGDADLDLRHLERARALAPDDLDVLAELGRVLTESESWARAIEVLSHRQALIEASGDKPRQKGWHLPLVRLYTACYQEACHALYGRSAGAPRPPGRPTADALDRSDALLDQGLAAARAWQERDSGAHGAFYTVKAIIASFRDDNAAATAWSGRSIEVAPTPHGYSTRASARNNHGDLDGAEEDARAALALDPDHHHADYVLACVGAKRGASFELLRPHFQRIAELWPEGRCEVLEEKDLAPFRDHPVFRELFGG